MAKKNLGQMCAELYESEELQRAVMKDAVRLGNVERIERGEMVLPSPQDAAHWHERETGRTVAAEKAAGVQRDVDELKATVAALRDQLADKLAEGG